ncbi:S-adenosylmethionine-dependent methyltransferase [Chitinispirillum alkaliphilum]|nr:S-adenosylmethionine-dependent methyltransferase [Chitinispirillum alkaliphilum]
MKNDTGKQNEYSELSDNYFWFYGHYTLGKLLVKKHSDHTNLRNLLNIGCGPNSLFSSDLNLKVINADYSFEACRLSRKKGNSLHVCCDAQNLPFKENHFEMVTGFEILEHLEYEIPAGKEIHRVLKPDGHFILSVPAYRFLWGSHDEWNNHYRRYTKKDIVAFAENCNLTVGYSTYYKSIYVLPLYILRQFKKRFSRSVTHDFVRVGRTANFLLKSLLFLEASIASVIPLPAGVSFFSVLMKSKRP